MNVMHIEYEKEIKYYESYSFFPLIQVNLQHKLLKRAKQTFGLNSPILRNSFLQLHTSYLLHHKVITTTLSV